MRTLEDVHVSYIGCSVLSHFVCLRLCVFVLDGEDFSRCEVSIRQILFYHCFMATARFMNVCLILPMLEVLVVIFTE